MDARVDADTIRASRLADLRKGVLHSPYVPAKMLAHAIELDRTARSDIEEGAPTRSSLLLDSCAGSNRPTARSRGLRRFCCFPSDSNTSERHDAYACGGSRTTRYRTSR